LCKVWGKNKSLWIKFKAHIIISIPVITLTPTNRPRVPPEIHKM
jgi:hypothetical protein